MRTITKTLAAAAALYAFAPAAGALAKVSAKPEWDDARARRARTSAPKLAPWRRPEGSPRG